MLGNLVCSLIFIYVSVVVLQVNTDDLSELLQNIGDDMWAISEDTVKTLGNITKLYMSV
jgi:hypothetical protein